MFVCLQSVCLLVCLFSVSSIYINTYRQFSHTYIELSLIVLVLKFLSPVFVQLSNCTVCCKLCTVERTTSNLVKSHLECTNYICSFHSLAKNQNQKSYEITNILHKINIFLASLLEFGRHGYYDLEIIYKHYKG